MRKMFGFLGATAGGWMGWYAGGLISLYAAFLISMVGTGVGMYVGFRFAERYS